MSRWLLVGLAVSASLAVWLYLAAIDHIDPKEDR